MATALALCCAIPLAVQADPEEPPSMISYPADATSFDLTALIGELARFRALWITPERLCILEYIQPVQAYQAYRISVLDTTTQPFTPVAPARTIERGNYCDRIWVANGGVKLLFHLYDHDEDDGTVWIKEETLTVSANCSMSSEFANMPSGYHAMPGGKTAILEKGGNLFAVDTKTGKQRLLLKGVMPKDLYNHAFDTRSYHFFRRWTIAGLSLISSAGKRQSDAACIT